MYDRDAADRAQRPQQQQECTCNCAPRSLCQTIASRKKSECTPGFNLMSRGEMSQPVHREFVHEPVNKSEDEIQIFKVLYDDNHDCGVNASQSSDDLTAEQRGFNRIQAERLPAIRSCVIHVGTTRALQHYQGQWQKAQCPSKPVVFLVDFATWPNNILGRYCPIRQCARWQHTRNRLFLV